MSENESVILVTLLEAAASRWSVAAIDSARHVRPLVQSESGDLDAYRDLVFDEQVSFLRHRIAGSLQRGIDRLWPLKLKASNFVVWFDESFAETDAPLIQRVADNFVQWIAKPPVVCFSRGFIAGELPNTHVDVITPAMTDICRMAGNATSWEILPRRNPT